MRCRSPSSPMSHCYGWPTLKAADRLPAEHNEIIQEVGYSNITQFYKIFELNYNLTPAEYRRRYRDSYADAPPL